MKPNQLLYNLITVAIFIGSMPLLGQPATADDDGFRGEGSRTRIEQPSIRFFCNFDNGTATLHIKTARGDVAILSGNEYFTTSGFTLQQGCEEISNRFQAAYNQEVLDYLLFGTDANAICASRKGNCDVILFRLKPNENPNLILRQISDSLANQLGLFRTGGFSPPITVDIGRMLIAASTGEGASVANIRGRDTSITHPRIPLTIQAKTFEELQRQISRHRETGDRKNEAVNLTELGAKYISLNQFTKALETYNQALVIYKQMGDRTGEGDTLRKLANLYTGTDTNLLASNLITKDLIVFSAAATGVGSTLPASSNQTIQPNRRTSKNSAIQQSNKPENQSSDSSPINSQTSSEVPSDTGEQSLPCAFEELYTLTNKKGSLFHIASDNFFPLPLKVSLYAQALTLRQQALNIYKELKNRPKQVETLNEIGSTYQDLGQYPKALGFYQEALKLSLVPGDYEEQKIDEMSILNNIGEVYRKQGRYSRALDFYNRAFAISDNTADNLRSIDLPHLPVDFDFKRIFLAKYGAFEKTALTNSVIDPTGHFKIIHLATHATFEGTTLAKPATPLSAIGAILNNVGLVHDELGQHSVAISFYRRALQLRRDTGDRRSEGTTLHNLGFVYDQLKQNDKAIQFYQDALAVRRKTGDLRGEAITLNNLGLVYNDQKQYSKALEQLQSALKTFETLGDRSNTGNTLDSLATVYKSLKQYATAQDYYQRAIAILREVGDRNTLGISLTNLGDLYEQKGDKPNAIATYQQAIDESLETILADLKGEALQAAFSAKHADTYARLINLLWDTGRFEDAFNYVERAKARAFLNQMAGEPINLRAGADATLLKEEQARRAELTDLNNQLKSFSNRVLGEDDKQEIAKLKANLDARQQSYAQLLEQLQRQNPETADLVSVNPAKLADIQRLLDQNTTLVEYFVTDDRTLAFLITRNSFKAVPLGVGRSALTEGVRSLYEYDFATLQKPHPASLKRLHQWLIQPLKSQISTGKLKIVPHNILHYVPFAALTDGQKFLIDDYTLSTLPSASVMRFLAKKHKPDNGKLLVFGNPTLDLSYASQEANVVAEMYKTQAIVGAKATKDALRAQAKQESILHLATHGEFNAINPLFSALFLAPNKGKDDRLEVHEIYELDLTKATNLVVLSACQSQVGELSRGDELVGLNRAFLYAGTPSVIASLWNIDDQATGLLMQKFYGYLRQGNGKAEALQKAQREVRAEYAHPYYWAAFVLTGDGD